ncbi:MAG: cofactor assembly of complex C subunit B [Oscillatoriales cyanobacterium C42_A2020_001]|nr:cofactor assembly of complex C subunit B [Leptolyngbyaceae cyanobacterium C42_A2020_001]
MSTPVLSSTFLLTLLLLVGLFFFIRASVKDRTQTVKLVSDLPEESLAGQLQQYFSQRAYKLVDVDSESNQIAFEGIVRPSFFLAVFLTVLTAIGTLSLSLVLSILLPDFSIGAILLVALSPLAGIFYWKNAKRPEKVLLKVESEQSENQLGQSVITVIAHRDELLELQRTLPLKTVHE